MIKVDYADGHYEQWDVGYSNGNGYLKRPAPAIKVEADGAELQLVLSTFNHLPIKYRQSKMIWRGDFAAFIVDNIG
jgi:hypothetical protein